MSAKSNTPDPSATPEVVVENLRAAVYASHEELSAQVQADSALDSKLLGLLGFFAIAASILLTLPHGLHDGRVLLLAGAGLGAVACFVGSMSPAGSPLRSAVAEVTGPSSNRHRCPRPLASPA